MASTALLVMDVQQGIVDRFAADLDYQLTVLADGCLDADPRGAPGPDGEGVSPAGRRHRHRRLDAEPG